MPNTGLSLANLLGGMGAAISPKGSWQQGLGEGVSRLSGEAQEREFLSGLLGGQSLQGMHGLSPNFILQALGMKAQLEQQEAQRASAEASAPLKHRKAVAEVRKAEADADRAQPTTMEVAGEEIVIPAGQRGTMLIQKERLNKELKQAGLTFEDWQHMSAEERQEFAQYRKDTRGGEDFTGLVNALAEREAFQRQRHQVDRELTLGTPESMTKRIEGFNRAEINRMVDAYPALEDATHAATAMAIDAERDELRGMHSDKYTNVVVEPSGPPNFLAFFGVLPDGTKERLGEPFNPDTIRKSR